MKVFALQILKRLDHTLFNELLINLDINKQEKIKKFYRWQDAHRALFSDLLVRMILIKLKEMKNSDISFVISKLGKPFLPDYLPFHFNISHSGDWIFCIIGHDPVGIDVELIADIDLSISRNYFCLNEHFNIIHDAEPIQKFFEYWVLKESYIKMIGKGLSQPLNSFMIKHCENGNILIEANNQVVRDVYLKLYPVNKSYKMATCSTSSDFPESIIAYEVKDVLNTFVSLNNCKHH